MTPERIKELRAFINKPGLSGTEGVYIAQVETSDCLDTIESQAARIEELEAALMPFADFFPKVDQFIEGTVRFGGSPIMPTRAFTRADFQRASAALQLKEPS